MIIKDREGVESRMCDLQLKKAESMTLMAKAIAHRFNNHFQTAMGNLELAMADLQQAGFSSIYLNEVMRSLCKASEVSGHLMMYLGHVYGPRELMDLSEVCRTFLSSGSRDARMVMDLPFPGPIVDADAGLIRQVLSNLVANAREASREVQGAVHLRIKTVPSSEIQVAYRFPAGWEPRASAYACIEVADSGCGIEREDVERIFDPFFSSKFFGRGLGLPVAMGIMKAHQGVVTVESEPGKGSIFRAYLPEHTEEALHGPGEADCFGNS